MGQNQADYDGNWINQKIVIDFPVSENMKKMMMLAETSNAKQDYSYFNYAESLDLGCKELYARGKMTKQQWDKIIGRYKIS